MKNYYRTWGKKFTLVQASVNKYINNKANKVGFTNQKRKNEVKKIQNHKSKR